MKIDCQRIVADFAASLAEIFEHALGLHARLIELLRGKPQRFVSDVSARVRLYGQDFTGACIIHCAEPLAAVLTGSMLRRAGKQEAACAADIRDAVAEIANVITAQLKVLVAAQGVAPIRMTIPLVLANANWDDPPEGCWHAVRLDVQGYLFVIETLLHFK